MVRKTNYYASLSLNFILTKLLYLMSSIILHNSKRLTTESIINFIREYKKKYVFLFFLFWPITITSNFYEIAKDSKIIFMYMCMNTNEIFWFKFSELPYIFMDSYILWKTIKSTENIFFPYSWRCILFFNERHNKNIIKMTLI